MRVTPLRFTTLQCSQIGFTLVRTFTGAPDSSERKNLRPDLKNNHGSNFKQGDGLRHPDTVASCTNADSGHCGRTTIYRYFGNRDNVIVEVVVRQARRLLASLVNRLATLPDSPDKVVEALVLAVDVQG